MTTSQYRHEQKIMRRDALQIPANVSPTGRRCISLSIPDDDEWEAQFFGVLSQLSKWTSFQNDPDKQATVVASVWRDTILNYYKGCGVDCDCLVWDNGWFKKFVPDGHGGGTYKPLDPRTDGPVDPPWVSPPEGQTGNCLTAANVVATFKTFMGTLVNLLDASAGFASLLVAVTDFMGLVLPVVGEIVSIAAHIAVAAGDVGAAEMRIVFVEGVSDSVYKALTCSLECFGSPDGSFSQSQLNDALNDFYGKLPGLVDDVEEALWRAFVDDWFTSQGPNGVTLAGNKGGVTSYDCSDCNCGWVHDFDFTVDDGGFTVDPGAPYGHWELGHGWVTSLHFNGTDYSWDVSLQRLFDSRDITLVRFDYDLEKGSVFLSGRSNYIDLFTDSTLVTDIAIPSDEQPDGNNTLQLPPGVNTANTLYIQTVASYAHTDAGGTATIKSLRIAGDGTDPFI